MIKTILLIDDDHATNEYHKIIIKNANVCENLVVHRYADKALEWLKSINKKELPELILLDINMPRMNGFEFLEKYEKMFTDPSHSVIVMLTTSINSTDKKKSLKFDIHYFVNKPLTVYWLQSIHSEMSEKSK